MTDYYLQHDKTYTYLTGDFCVYKSRVFCLKVKGLFSICVKKKCKQETVMSTQKVNRYNPCSVPKSTLVKALSCYTIEHCNFNVME